MQASHKRCTIQILKKSIKSSQNKIAKNKQLSNSCLQNITKPSAISKADLSFVCDTQTLP
jgi:hypothetical protein